MANPIKYHVTLRSDRPATGGSYSLQTVVEAPNALEAAVIVAAAWGLEAHDVNRVHVQEAGTKGVGS